MPASPYVTKAVFLNAVACRTRGWFLRAGMAPAPKIADKMRMDDGLEVGRRARAAFPGGVLVPHGANETAARATQGLIGDPAVQVIYEATFIVEGRIKARHGAGHRHPQTNSAVASPSSGPERESRSRSSGIQPLG